jgi:hypothetical protein
LGRVTRFGARPDGWLAAGAPSVPHALGGDARMRFLSRLTVVVDGDEMIDQSVVTLEALGWTIDDVRLHFADVADGRRS